MKTFEKSEAVWRGDIPAWPKPINELAQLARPIWFFNGLSNMVVVETTSGLVILDPGALTPTPSEDGVLLADCQRKYQAVRSLTGKPLHTVIYTHGHLDHIYGVPQYLREPGQADQAGPHVIAHEAFTARMGRYRAMRGQIAIINRRQFGGRKDMEMSAFNEDFTYPNVLYKDELELEVGGTKILIRHGRGETDDHSWVFFPEDRILCTGDFFIWAMPNAGNPQKVQRYALEWAGALRKMASLRPEILSPGHGLPIIGQGRVMKALDDTASFLEHLSDQVLGLMNKGTPLQEIVESVVLAPDLLKLPYLQPAYDEVEFLVRNIWRLYGGWYDGIPSHLKPASEKTLAKEILTLVGDQKKLLNRVEEMLDGGDVRLATHLAEWAFWAAPNDEEACRLMKRVYQERAQKETSIMAKGIFLSAANEIPDAGVGANEPNGIGSRNRRSNGSRR